MKINNIVLSRGELVSITKTPHYTTTEKTDLFKLDTHSFFQRKRLFVKLYNTLDKYTLNTPYNLN